MDALYVYTLLAKTKNNKYICRFDHVFMSSVFVTGSRTGIKFTQMAILWFFTLYVNLFDGLM